MLFFAAPLLALAAVVQDGDAAAVARLLEQRCSACHSEGSDRPKASRKWATAADLAATARNLDLIVPGDPDESELFLQVDFGDMPPEDAESAPLDESEKALLAAWITNGAVVPEGLGSEESSAEAADPDWVQSPLVHWVSHFHPLIVHFPVALLTAALLAELLFRIWPTGQSDRAANFCLALGALAALPSAGLGWLLAANTTHPGFDLDLHRWLGTSTAVLAIFVWWGTRRWPGKRLPLLLLVAAIVGATGHTGGTLSFGADWLTPPF